MLWLRLGRAMFIGRNAELDLISTHLKDTTKAQLLILYGRRRVGKSTLIRESLKNEKRVLHFEGLQGESTQIQIQQFLEDLSRQTGRIKLAAKNWLEVFQGLGEVISSGRWVLVFDELPWMAAGRHRLVADLKLYWDRWAKNTDLVLILCGSVASFMTKHLVHSKALHNRKTLEICLGPLSPQESALFIPQRSNFEKAQLYMCLGGVPKYLEQINPRFSIEKNLNTLCFTSNGFFVHEFEALFKEQFRAAKTYESLVDVLSQGPAGLSDLSARTEISRGGGLLEHLQNLIRAQFVKEYFPHSASGKKRKKTKLYKLVDPFLLFYFRYMHPQIDLIEKNKSENLFKAIVGPSQHTYYGLAFERLCEDAFAIILKKLKLKLADIIVMGPYFQQKTKNGSGLQIDNLIMRRDQVWTLVEYKYSKNPMDVSVIAEFSRKIESLKAPSNISIEKVLVSAAGVTAGVAKSKFFDHILTLEDLF